MPYYLKFSFWKHFITKKNLIPNYNLKDINDISIDELKQKGIEGIVFDVDNTLTKHCHKDVYPNIQKTFQLLQKNFKCILYSNCDANRYEELQTIFNLPLVKHGIKKPNIEGYQNACKKLNLSSNKIAFIGDRVMTDILGANLAGMTSILVEAFDNNEPRIISIMRKLERRRIKK